MYYLQYVLTNIINSIRQDLEQEVIMDYKLRSGLGARFEFK